MQRRHLNSELKIITRCLAPKLYTIPCSLGVYLYMSDRDILVVTYDEPCKFLIMYGILNVNEEHIIMLLDLQKRVLCTHLNLSTLRMCLTYSFEIW